MKWSELNKSITKMIYINDALFSYLYMKNIVLESVDNLKFFWILLVSTWTNIFRIHQIEARAKALICDRIPSCKFNRFGTNK